MLAPNTDRLIDILSHKRPHLSETDEHIIRKTFGHLATGDAKGLSKDKFGNRYYTIPTPPGLPKIIWACHTDTVHREHGAMKGINKQRLSIDKGIIRLHPGEKDSNCLGGDDGVGMWLISEMIANGVPGRYLIHRGEERGCLGSAYIAKNMSHVLDGYVACISLDRMGTTEIITHQYGDRTCSTEFASSLAKALKMHNQLIPSSNGMRTDSDNYKTIIPECTNVGVGYEDAHGKEESVDMNYAVYLRDHLCQIDLSQLEIKRDPTKKEPPAAVYAYGYARNQVSDDKQIAWLLVQKLDRYYGPRDEDGRFFDRVKFKWILPEQREPWPPVEGGATLLDHNKGGQGKVIDLRPGYGFRSKDDGRKLTKKERKRAKRAAQLAKKKYVQSQADWSKNYDPNGPADLKIIFCDQLTKFINRHARDFAEAVVAAGWSPTDVQTMMFDKHGKMYDLENVGR